MNLTFYYTPSENNKVGKSLTAANPLTGTLRDECDVLNPQILVHAASLSAYNYAYIPQFNRYYFIREITSYRTGLWLVKLAVDVLYTYQANILNVKAILQETEVLKPDPYLADPSVWVSKVKDKTSIINFPSGLSENGDYILITAGGGSPNAGT